jgi:hypothetical protein
MFSLVVIVLAPAERICAKFLLRSSPRRQRPKRRRLRVIPNRHPALSTFCCWTADGRMSGRCSLARASVDAVGQWRYQPTLLNGTPVEIDTEIDVIFSLQL